MSWRCTCRGYKSLIRIWSKSGWDKSGRVRWMLRNLCRPCRHVLTSCTLWHSTYVECAIWVCIRSKYPEGSGHGVIFVCSWALTKVVKAYGDKKYYCCQRSRISISVGEIVSNFIRWLLVVEKEYMWEVGWGELLGVASSSKCWRVVVRCLGWADQCWVGDGCEISV